MEGDWFAGERSNTGVRAVDDAGVLCSDRLDTRVRLRRGCWENKSCCLCGGWVWGEVVDVGHETDKLFVILANLCRVSLYGVGEYGLHGHSDGTSRLERRGQRHPKV